ncbi:hypothetical protein HPB48_017359 [Haemaphysalis longicornis]|uniref:Uncharacterized protein n=1 Tax=Haemaphysalis longicornis TaxID=44386 RepID=A0A9J6G118_HAELO|nr:hypothetical protein HPB48_017359 [Haemaphysalis longicornis]
MNEQERISEGVDVLSRTKPAPSSLPIKRVRTFLEERDLTVLPADKESGLAFLSSKLYKCKSDQAVSSVFASHDDVNIAKLKRHALKLCKQSNLSNLSKDISGAKRLCSGFFQCENT